VSRRGWACHRAGLRPLALLLGDPFLTHYHTYVSSRATELHLSTTLIFDIGVYLTVVGVAAMAANLFAEGIA
jgi:multicomponent Na+:H+ antiporter subunit B